MLDILFISTYDSFGGAARATYRIFESLKTSEIRCKMYTAIKNTEDESIHQLVCLENTEKLKFVHHLLESIRIQRFKRNRILESFGKASAGIIDEINSDSADIVHLHWICNYLSVQDIGHIRKPIVWTLHDMWPFSGSEHSTFDINTFVYQDSELDPLQNSPTIELFNEKVLAWDKQNFNIVAPSNWLAERARKSILFRSSAIHVIPFPIKTSFWRPKRKKELMKKFPFNPNKFQILFIGQNMINDPTKGWDLLLESLIKLNSEYSLGFELVLAGHEGDCPQELPFNIISLGQIQDDQTLVQLYSSVHVLVIPSRAEAFSLVTCEAHSCGLPVVGYEIGGIPDIVIHQKTGWITEPFDTSDFADGIQWVLSNQERRSELSANSRRNVIEKFSEEVVSLKYLELYETIARSPSY